MDPSLAPFAKTAGIGAPCVAAYKTNVDLLDFGRLKLRSSMAVLVSGLYSLASVFLISVTERMGATMIAIRNEMGESLSWHPAYSEPEFLCHLLFGLQLV